MGISPHTNNPWNGSQSEQVLWYGESYPCQDTMPIYTQPRQDQRPDQTGWNPNIGPSNQSFVSAASPTVQNKLRVPQIPRSSARMPKAQAQLLARNLKRGVLVSSLAAFAMLSMLVAGNMKNTLAIPLPSNQITDPLQSNPPSNSPSNSPSNPPSNPPSNSPSNPPSNPNDSGSDHFFDQGKGGGYEFGNDDSGQNPGTSKNPSTSTGVS
jgi:hypothetical protein